MKIISMTVVLFMIIALPAANAADGYMAQQPASAEFARVKSLVGTWQGTSVSTGEHAKDPEQATVEYRLTSGGTAVVETLFRGTDHEMVSVYHDQNGKLAMTHYCMLGNQPTLEVKAEDQTGLQLELQSSPTINQATDMHMHALHLSMPDGNSLTQEWTLFEAGRPNGTTTITLTRKA